MIFTEDENILFKFKIKGNSKYGVNPFERTFEQLLEKGVVNLDKHVGPTSHQETDNLKKILNIKRAGHSGTLDPRVTGVLLIGLNKATRLMEYMLKSNKEYVCHMFVHKEVPKNKIEEVLKKFTGTILQTPPIISAVKRQERERTIYSIELLNYENKGKDILFRVACQHGTYIRKLCSDIGETLGVGAQMKELRRTKAGPLREEDDIISLDKLRNLKQLYDEATKKDEKEIYEKELRKYIKPMEVILKDFKKVYVRDSAVDSISKGSDLSVPGVLAMDKRIQMGEEIAMMTQKGELIGMGMAFLKPKEVIKKSKGAFIKTNKVFMDTNYYPNFWDFKPENKNQIKDNSQEKNDNFNEESLEEE